MAENFLNRLARNPYAPIDAASVTRIDEMGNGLDDWGNIIAQAPQQPQAQSWGDLGYGIATAPMRFGNALAQSVNPYKGNEHPITDPNASNWQVPPLISESWDAINSFGNAYSNGMSEDDMRRNANIAAGLTMGGGGLAARPAGSTGMFAGRLAKTADHEALARAEQMATQGADRNAIWNETGWFQGPDSKWRFEIDDSGAALKSKARAHISHEESLPILEALANKKYGKSFLDETLTEDMKDPLFHANEVRKSIGDALLSGHRTVSGTMDDVLSHDALFDAYPSFRDIETTANINSNDVGASFDPRRQTANVPKIELSYRTDDGRFGRGNESGVLLSLHELQHAIQDYEGFSIGTTPIDPKLGFVTRESLHRYDNAAGEVEAINVEGRRAGHIADGIKGVRAPWRTQTVPYEDQILIWGDGLAANADSRASLPALASGVGDRQGITAYHGSPHDFDKFDLSKIGTGEGAQAYGHGLYFAENEGVARSYRKNLGYKDIVREFRNALPDDADAHEIKALAENGQLPPKMSRVINALAADDWLGFDYPSQAISASFRENLKNWDPSPELEQAVKDYGNMYQVRINANPEDFLDWDKPLSQQSEKVRNAIAPVADKAKEEYLQFQNDLARRRAQDDAQMLRMMGRDVPDDHTFNAPDPSDLLDMWDKRAAGDVALNSDAQAKLREAGIPGIRYLDQMSRNAGDGTSNYVVFDDSIIEILKKYGWVPPAAYGANALSQSQDNQY